MTYTTWFDELRRDDIERAGGKGANLGELSRAELPVPPGFVVTTDAYDAFVDAGGLKAEIMRLAGQPRADDPAAFEAAAEQIRALFARGDIPEAIAADIRAAYERLAATNEAAVAVRSSATAEDLAEASFAGQQETFLNVRGSAALLEAVRDCWASLWTARAMAYRARQGIDPASVSLAVVVQRMVDAEASGVLFTANPANGRREQAMISAAWGLGESIVAGSVTPDLIVVDKESGRVLSRETADKAVMTVATAEGAAERPVAEARRRQPALDDRAAAALARYGAQIEAHYGAPQDIEWALAGGELFILQARPITALPEPMMDPPTDWSVPDPRGFYGRASIVEQMPDPLTPLFADLSRHSVVWSLETLFNKLLGEGVLRAGEIDFLTVNGYAYYYYRLGFFWRLLRLSPGSFWDVLKSARGLWRDEYHPHYVRQIDQWAASPPRDRPAAELLAGARALLDGGARYYTSVQMIIPLAYLSEMFFTLFYDRLVRRAGDPPAPTFLLGYESLPIRAEQSLYDLAAWSRAQPGLAEALAGVPSDRAGDLLAAEAAPAGVEEELWREWRRRFQAHLDRYGHMVYNLDFINPTPADEPAPLLNTLAFYLRGGGTDPHARQQRAAARREAATAAVAARLEGPRRTIFVRLLRWAQEVAPAREDALGDIGLAWPLMRRLLLELGRRLTAAEAITRPVDVFWLRSDELQALAAALDAGQTRLDSHAEAVERRKMEWRGQKRVAPPQLLPERSWVMAMEGLMPARSNAQTGNVISGVGASQGQITAPARVLGGPEDFGQMQPGEVLVAGITTPAWTSLFAMAAAVVTDIGGPLSHSSIVAREYGIPAVLGTGVATRRIASGQMVRVDGDAGTVTLLDGAGAAGAEQEVVQPAAGASATARRVAIIALAVGAAVGVIAWRRRQG